MNRRDFLKTSAATSGSLLMAGAASAAVGPGSGAIEAVTPKPAPNRPRLPDLSPARWIWYPSERTLQNTFILFRREVELKAKPVRATGWIAAESRYRLEVNGQRIQWGPAPSDPRWPEADPLDLTQVLHEGRNVLGAIVL
jgi:alpha-L-rhamnosidase